MCFPLPPPDTSPIPCSLAEIPVFQDQADADQSFRIPLLPDRLQVIIPAYTFTCHARVVQWGACVERGRDEDRYDIDFQILRPSPVSDPGVDCYSLVGSNLIENRQSNDRCIVYDVPVEEQVLVQPGDVVGFFSDVVNRTDNRDGVQVIESRQDVVVHYRVHATIPATDPESCVFVVGSGPDQIDSSTTLGPVITAVVGELIIKYQLNADTVSCWLPYLNLQILGGERQGHMHNPAPVHELQH